MASSTADLPHPYRDPVNTARETRARYRFQDECVTLRCIHNLVSGQVTSIVVEWSSDYLTLAADRSVELVSIKHREPDQPAWTRSKIGPVLTDLHRYWRAVDERCTCVFASSIGISGDVTTLDPAILAGWLEVSEAEAARFWRALRLPTAATVLPRRNEITAVAVADLRGVLKHLDRDPAFAEECYAALATRIARTSIDEPATPAQRIARMSGSIRSVLERTGPDLAAQTLRMNDLRALVLATHDAYADRVPPVAARQVAPVVRPSDDVDWHGGSRLNNPGGVFLIHDPVAREQVPDRSHICRRAKARQLEPIARDVWLTQVTLLRDCPAGRARLAALQREADLLMGMATVSGAPRLVAIEAKDSTAMLVIELPAARPLPDVLGTPGAPYPGLVLDALLRGVAPLLDVLAALHRLGCAHRALAPDCLMVTAQGRILPRDLGLAALVPVPGEGPADYRAPEQDRPLLIPIGPHTDVYQLAAIVYHLVTGQPAGPAPIPPTVLRPDLSPQLDHALLAALDADHRRRSSLWRLRSDLDRLMRAGGTAAAA